MTMDPQTKSWIESFRSSGDGALAGLLAVYVDRLLAGEKLDPEQLRLEHPTLAVDLIAALETFGNLGSRGALTAAPRLAGFEILRTVGRGGAPGDLGCVKYSACP